LHRAAYARIGLVSAAALMCCGGAMRLMAESAADGPRTAVAPRTQLPPVIVEGKRRPTAKRQKAAPSRARIAAPATAPEPTAGAGAPAGPSAGGVQSGAAGTVGYVATRSTTATRTDTPLINVPQSVTVLTREFIRDQSFQSLVDAVRYAPGVVPHQGEGNRDQVLIRGMSTSADFFVNGIRDDVQYYRDLYNIYRIEVLKGPNAMIFGRGGGGGVINRVLKEADFVPIHELTVATGMFGVKRASVDVGDALVGKTLAGRINAVYENSDSYRKYVNLERYGVNPTATWRPNDATTVKVAYEYFHDGRVADRGIPSQFGLPYRTDPSTFFGNPLLNQAHVDAHIATAVFEHDTDFGLKIRNNSRFANYDKFYQNIFPGGAVNAAGTAVNLSAYNHETDRRNLFNQTDLIYKADLGWVRHTLLAGAEVGQQTGLDFRQDGFFPNGTQSLTVSPLNPTSYAPVTFRNIPTGSNNNYALDLAAGYVQDQMEITKYFQVISGLRLDRFDFSSTDRRSGVTLNRIDDVTSPRLGVVFKPIENFAFYGSYSISYLPSSGDQFASLNPGTAIAAPEKFVNKEVGIKWDISPKLQFMSAVFDLTRSNQRLADPNNPGFFILSGRTKSKGFETSLTGHVTDAWQVMAGYSYTDARIASATSAIILAGNRVGLVPYDTFTLWNRYQFTETWAAGVGYIYTTSSFASSDDTVRLPGFTRVDAAVFARIDKDTRVQVNVENVFNTRYAATADGNNNITPGSPRAVRGTMIVNF
jgi:catecholate siderophore receptor